MQVVIVESPSKAKTINKYLGSDFKVLASYGHIRDLPSKDGSVKPDDDFSMIWELDAGSKKRVNEIAAAVKGADRLVLATDPDREGEAISWHLYELLKERGLLDNKEVRRVVFYEITKRAVQDAIENPRELSNLLVNAQQTRRALDYLFGFNMSPLLWKKIAPRLSAGRVQSVAVRLLVERERERRAGNHCDGPSVRHREEVVEHDCYENPEEHERDLLPGDGRDLLGKGELHDDKCGGGEGGGLRKPPSGDDIHENREEREQQWKDAAEQ